MDGIVKWGVLRAALLLRGIAARLACGVLFGGAAASAQALPVCPVADGASAIYDINRGGHVIGRHTIRFTRRGAELTVDVTVEAALYALGVRVYRYEHHGRETWHDGQMVAMVTRTEDDGTKHQVDASLTGGVWRGTTGPAPGPAPLLATSLWNSESVRQTRLLDNETGEVTPVHSTAAGRETIQLVNRQVTATKFVTTGGAAGSVWYDENGCWVRALFASPVDGSQIDVRAR